MTLKVAKLNGIHLHYADHGKQDGPVVVFSNSLGTDLRIWDDVVAHLSSDYRLITYDKRGHGLSGIGDQPYSIELHTRDLLALLDHLQIDRAVICGLSVGGMIAQHIAAMAPDRISGLVLCDTAPKIGDAAAWNSRIDAIEKGGMEAIGDAVIARWLTDDYRATQTAMTALYHTMLVRCPVAGYGGTCAAIRDADLTENTAKIDLPVMCVAGSVDLSTPPELVGKMAALVPNAGFTVIENVGHLPPVETPDQLAGIIDTFIRENGLG
ncbi:3-oxoadipate enol-lactonase [Thalassospira profundimaris]|uniref:3-oxoadipate enol-lactonase n=1 Tax=Thalassospira profundimaris TaxID=502049 RepID=A0A367XH00_9PROT|nr:3-oxoadipate enol-lactonase [Thalassospira profundimaris]RCK52410.1 3-oxoadipate enol-lactonase [Thalassospira profundimaris]